MISPTIGRVVWYYPAGRASTDQPLPALVSYVWNDRMVNLAAFTANGTPLSPSPTSVTLVQDGDPIPEGQYCTWMPYQKAVASGQIAPALHAPPR